MAGKRSDEVGVSITVLSVTSMRTGRPFALASDEIEIDCGPLDEEADTVLATVLREAVTNMLRHSEAQNCTVQARMAQDVVRLQVTNDGMPSSAASHRKGGGLENLAMRLEAVGGKLSVSRHEGRFEVLATLATPAIPTPVTMAAERTEA